MGAEGELAPATLPEGTPQPLTAERRRLERRVLLAEDNEVNQEVAIAMLEDLDCRVTVVDNGRLAVEAVQRDEFEIVLMDCQMPELDGFAATETIRTWERERDAGSEGPGTEEGMEASAPDARPRAKKTGRGRTSAARKK